MFTMKQKLSILTVVAGMMIFAVSCGDSEKKSSAEEEQAPITEENAIEQADDLLKEIEQL